MLVWQVPRFDAPEATRAFRTHPGHPVMVDWAGEPFVFVVETRRDDPPGVLYGVRVRDGFVSVRHPLSNAGQRFATPLVLGERVIVSICDPDAAAGGRMEAIDLYTGTP